MTWTMFFIVGSCLEKYSTSIQGMRFNSGCHYYFSGKLVLYPPDDRATSLGEMMDDNTRSSILKDISLSETRLVFTKKYAGGEIVYFSLEKEEDGSWSGPFMGPEGVMGTAHCKFIPVPENFQYPKE